MARTGVLKDGVFLPDRHKTRRDPRQKEFEREPSGEGELRDGPGRRALGLRTPGHGSVRAPQGQTLSAWRPHPNAKRGWGSAAPAQGAPKTTPDPTDPRSSPAQRWEGLPAAHFFPRRPHSGPPHLRPRAPGPSASLGAPAAPAPPHPADARSRPTRGWQGIRPAATGVPRERTPGAPQRRGDCGPGGGGGGSSRAPQRRPGRKPPGPPAGGREFARSPDAGRGGERSHAAGRGARNRT